MRMNLILKYFPHINQSQRQQFEALFPLYKEWNSKINVISRKDIDNLYLHHVLHSLAIAKVVQFKPGTKILDIGTGGGFPGIPLAIMFPESRFHLVDSIGKKITVVNSIYQSLGLKNVTTEIIRAENLKNQYHFIVSRAVTDLTAFLGWSKGKVSNHNINDLPNGVLYLKGGELFNEENRLTNSYMLYKIPDYFAEDYFANKYVAYLKLIIKAELI